MNYTAKGLTDMYISNTKQIKIDHGIITLSVD